MKNGLPPPPGWYPDPADATALRWWNGQTWTDATRRVRKRLGIVSGDRGRAISAAVASGASAGMAVTAVIIVIVLIRGRAIPHLAIGLVVAIPLLVVGQLWTIALINARQPPRPRGWRATLRSAIEDSQRNARNPAQLFFGDLDKRLARAFIGLFVVGWLVALTAFPSLTNGSPAPSGNGCQYRLSQHGTSTCVSPGTYYAAGAAEQRLAAGVLLAFFSIHAGAAIGRLRSRRPTE